MKLTLETTNSKPEYTVKVSYESGSDDLNIDEVVELVKSVLTAYGFSPENVNGCFNTNQ